MFTSPTPRAYPVDPIQVTPGDTNWHVIGVKAGTITLYSSISAMQTDGAIAWPSGNPGQQNTMLNVKCLATGGATDGSECFFWFNKQVSTNLLGKSVSPGKDISVQLDLYNVWVKTTVNTDIIELVASY